MKKINILILSSMVILISVPTVFAWTNICPDKDVYYCQDVGKAAYNATGAKMMREIKLGKIIGVVYKRKGSLISKTSQRLSPRNAHYYIIDDGAGPDKAFIRQCREIDAK